MSHFAGYFHDAALLWEYGLNQTLEAGGSYRDGEVILANIINATIEGTEEMFSSI